MERGSKGSKDLLRLYGPCPIGGRLSTSSRHPPLRSLTRSLTAPYSNLQVAFVAGSDGASERGAEVAAIINSI